MRDRTQEFLQDLDKNIVAEKGVNLATRKTLVLNADYQPMRYFPLSLQHWKWVMELVVKGIITGIPRLQVLEEYDDVYVRTPSRKFNLPSVVAHVAYVQPPKHVPFTKFNVFLRDDFRCQYTGEKCAVEDLTYDHVIPRDYGGKTVWTNIVAASRRMNELKDNRTPEEAGMTLIGMPHEPSYHELLQKGRRYPPKYLHESWIDYCYWDTEIDSDS